MLRPHGGVKSEFGGDDGRHRRQHLTVTRFAGSWDVPLRVDVSGEAPSRGRSSAITNASARSRPPVMASGTSGKVGYRSAIFNGYA